MRVNWKRVMIAALWSELLLLAIYVPAKRFEGSLFLTIAFADMFGSMFLGGLWIARKVESRFVLHGALVGIVDNIIYAPIVVPMLVLTGYILLGQLGLATDGTPIFVFGLFGFILKMIGSTVGAYVGGRWHKKLQSLHAVGTTS